MLLLCTETLKKTNQFYVVFNMEFWVYLIQEEFENRQFPNTVEKMKLWRQEPGLQIEYIFHILS